MKNFSAILSLFICSFLPLSAVDSLETPTIVIEEIADDQNRELEMMELLIASTKQNLITQEALLTHLASFKQSQQRFMEDNNDKQLAAVMIDEADCALNLIIEQHYEDLFQTEFLKELKFFSQFSAANEVLSP